MPAELHYVKTCRHGNVRCWEKEPLIYDHVDPPMKTCEGGSVTVLDPERVLWADEDHLGQEHKITIQSVIDTLEAGQG